MDLKPLLVLDVDGPLNPYLADPVPDGYEVHDLLGYRVLLNPSMGPELTAFADLHGMELAWATTWEHDANRYIGPLIGLPELPVIEWGLNAKFWKFNGVLEYAGDRPLAWLDDDFRHFPHEEDWFRRERDWVPTLLHEVDPAVGITDLDLEAIEEWVKSL